MATNDREKAAARKEEREIGPARAILRGLGMSARKVRVVADLMRGSDVASAMTMLTHQPRAAAKPLKKLLESAVANAADRQMNVDNLVISQVLVHKGAIGKRFMQRAQGRATPIRKQSSHIELSVTEEVI
jgi:large subunit ribosomal protein L22